MYNDNYPPGVSDSTPGAPWNEPADNEPTKVEVEYSCVMRRVCDVETTNYTKEECDDYERDEDGGYVHYGGTEILFDEDDFRGEYDEQRFSPAELIDELKTIVTMLINGDEVTVSRRKLRQILEDCEGWEIEDEECGKA